MKNLILALLIAVLAVGCGTALAANPHGNPPGNDGGSCHGANKETCRPDPQPSHGQDCQPHGNNPDGNDDHCGPTPTPAHSVTPSTDPSVAPSVTPSNPFPNLTPPPTDTE